MKKTLQIGEKKITFESNALTPIVYEEEFNQDLFGTLVKLGEAFEGKDVSVDNISSFKNINFNDFTRMAYACAKSFDEDNTPPFRQWLVENKDYNVFTHGMEIMNLLTDSMNTQKK